MSKDPAPTPANRLTAVLPRRVVIRLAVASFVLSVLTLALVVFLGLFFAPTLAKPTARFLLLVLVALNFAVFFFVFYPQELSINRFELGVRLTGPLAVFFVVLFALWKWMHEPFPASYQFYPIYFGGRQVSKVEVTPTDPDPFNDFYVIKNQETGKVIGVLIKFPSADVQSVKAKVRAPAIMPEPRPVVFRRGVKAEAIDPLKE